MVVRKVFFRKPLEETCNIAWVDRIFSHGLLNGEFDILGPNGGTDIIVFRWFDSRRVLEVVCFH